MPSKATARLAHNEPGTATPPQPGKGKNTLRHDLGNELAVVTGFAWLALSSLRQLSEKLEGEKQAELQSIIGMVERVKASAENGRQLLAPVAPAAAEIETAPSTKHRVLAVDDSLPLLALLNKALTHSGYQVETFTDPRAALDRFGKTPDDFHAVITDEMMPDMTGATLAGELRAIRPSVPVVLCTGVPESNPNDDPDWAQAVIRKPYRPGDLLSLVGRVIAEATKAQPHT
jgi:CheY-like chemotaxis protein